MPMLKFGSAILVESSVNPSEWVSKVGCKSSKCKGQCKKNTCRIKVSKNVIARYSPEKYLLSHCTIIAAVDTESDSKNKKSHLIKPSFSKFVNNNGDAWTKGVLKNAYPSFIGAQNYLEHVQIEELSKGRVIDAVLRDIPVEVKSNDKTYYVDILVATSKKHKDLVKKITANELNSLSMGCLIQYSYCSKCGNKAVDESEACDHIKYQKRNSFYDKNGVKRVIAELCGHEDDSESVKFIEASWVGNPAFTGAVIRNVIEPPQDVKAKIEDAHKKDTYEIKESDFLKAASQIVMGKEAQKSDEELDPAAEEEETPVDIPEAPAGEEPTPEETPAGTEPETPAEAEPETTEIEPEESAVKNWKKDVKKKVLDDLGKEISDELAEESGEGRPQELETLDESIIKPAHTLRQVWTAKKSWDVFLKRTVGKLEKSKFKKLRYGTYIMLTSDDPTELSKLGFNRRDFLAVMSYLDNQFKDSLDISIKKAVSNLNGIKGLGQKALLKEIVSSIGRKLTLKEAKKSLIWLKLLDHYRD